MAPGVVDTTVRYRKPPRNMAAGWVHSPLLRGLSRFSTPSYDMFGDEFVESSDVIGLMNRGDSVNESASPEDDEAESMFIVTSPPI